MAKVVKVIELMSQSPKERGRRRAGAAREASKNLAEHSLYIDEFSADVNDGEITNYRINAKVTFDLVREK
jgi:Protein of unknown function (DUF1458).